MDLKDKQIGILMGGFSSEREISLKSGNAVVGALKNLGYVVKVIDFNDEKELISKIQESGVDCIFNVLHGRFGEDGQVQKILDSLKIPYTGSGVFASQLAMDKIASREIFIKNGILVPEYRVVNSEQNFNEDMFFQEFPLVVKPATEGSSIGLSIVENKICLFLSIENASRFDQNIIVEKYIAGREITVGILEEQPLPVIEIVPKNKFYDFQAKYTPGMTQYKVPADLPEKVYKKAQAQGQKAHCLLGCRSFSRVDMIINNFNEPVVLEVNTIPGLTATSLLPKAAAACGISFEQLCEKMVLSALRQNFNQTLTKT